MNVTISGTQQSDLIIENDSLKRSVEELSVLSEFATAVAGTLDLEKILRTIVRRSLNVFRASQGVITLVGADTGDPSKTLVRTAVSSGTNEQFHFNEGLLGWMLLNKKPLLLNDPRNDPNFSRLQWDEPVASLLCAPMIVKGTLTGVITIYNTEERLFTPDDQRLLSIIAIQMAQVVENARIEEEQRTMQITIARDLHDDVASSLSSIALYTERLKRLLGSVPPQALTMIDTINALSREAVEAMGDIVWSIAPEHDSMEELLVRIRQLAIEGCNAKEIRHTITVPELHSAKTIPVEIRRNIYLIFKEALNNALNHSRAAGIQIVVALDNGLFSLTVKDDGVGFSRNGMPDTSLVHGGHGLNNMHKRAREIDAVLTVESGNGKGTTVQITKKMT